MTLEEELIWRGFANQTTIKDLSVLEEKSVTFYWGVDPSAISMTVGNLAAAMMVRAFIAHGHKPILLVGGATGRIGDPDGKKQERDLQTEENVDNYKNAIVEQYKVIFNGIDFQVVDNYDWFKNMNYIYFLRSVGKKIPLRTMVNRDFVQSRMSEEGDGISYAEFSYSLIQAYDFLYLHENYGVTLQLSGADQWGNSIAGVDLIRRTTGDEAHVWTCPLVINQKTGKKFGKSEEGAIWLNPDMTSPTSFYQFWINLDDEGIESYLKIYTILDKNSIDSILEAHRANPRLRVAQTTLAYEVTKLIHGEQEAKIAARVTEFLTLKTPIDEANDEEIEVIKKQLPSLNVNVDEGIVPTLVSLGLAKSNTEATKFINERAISINGAKIDRINFETTDFKNGRLLIKKGKAFKDSALIELN